MDIFGFQEVRLEVGTKVRTKKKGKKKNQSVPTRSQVADLVSQLQGYQYVFQPAMLYMEKILDRKEEGLVIFSRYSIIYSDYILLPRLVMIKWLVPNHSNIVYHICRLLKLKIVFFLISL